MNDNRITTDALSPVGNLPVDELFEVAEDIVASVEVSVETSVGAVTACVGVFVGVSGSVGSVKRITSKQRR